MGDGDILVLPATCFAKALTTSSPVVVFEKEGILDSWERLKSVTVFSCTGRGFVCDGQGTMNSSRQMKCTEEEIRY